MSGKPGLTIGLGLGGAGLAGLAIGYGGTLPVTLAGALLMGLLATAALIRVWAALADLHGARRAVAMTEGEVSVSLAGIFTPLLIGGLAATALTWRFGLLKTAHAASSTRSARAASSRDTPVSTRVSGRPNIAATRSASAASASVGSCASQTSRR